MGHIPQDHYEPQTNTARWMEDRLPILSLSHHMSTFPTPKNLNYFWTFGSMLSFMLVAQIVTGIVLVMHYTPHTDLAFSSIEAYMRNNDWGWLMRRLHANGASMFFVALYIHMLRAIYYGSYKGPREVIWIVGVIVFIVMMATGFMGYVLPWGQMSYWGATVITNLFSAIPVVGDSIVTLLWGGFSVDNPTLGRFFSLHYLLPFLIAGLVVVHIWALHHVGNNNPIGVSVRDVKTETLPFWPYIVMKDVVGLMVFLGVLMYFVFYMPDYMGHADNYIEADPLKTPAHIVPEWYFLPFYAILRAIDFNVGPIDAKLGGVIAMFGSIIILFFLPWLDTSKVRSGRYRPMFRVCFFVFLAVVLVLGWCGAKPPDLILISLGHAGDGMEVGFRVIHLAQILTAYYFGFFVLLLPLLGLIEKPGAVPVSIAQSIADEVAKKTKVSNVIASEEN